MAKRPRRAPIPRVVNAPRGGEAPELLAEGDEADDEATSDDEAAILAEFSDAADGDVWEIRVYRHTGQRAGPKPYLFSCTPADFPIIDKLRDGYGTGEYRATVFRNKRFYRHFLYSVEAVRMPTIPTPTAPGTDLGGVLQEAFKRQSEFNEQLLQRITQQSGAGRGESLKEMVELATLMKTLIGPQTPSQGVTAKEMLELINAGMKLAQDAGGGDKSPAGIMDLLRDLIKSPMVEKILEGAAQGAAGALPAPAGPMLPPAQQPPAGADGEAPAPAPTEQERQAAALLQNLRFLVSKAAQDAEIPLYADFVMDNVTEAVLREIVFRDDALSVLKSLEPGVAQYEGWFIALLAELRAALTESGGAANAPAHVP